MISGTVLFSASAVKAAGEEEKGTEVSEEAQPTGAVQTADSAESTDNATGTKAVAAALAVGIAAAAGAISMGTAISKASESIARQPEAKGDIRGNLMLGLVFIETAIIYALIIGILIVFVL